MKEVDITGQKFGKLTAIKKVAGGRFQDGAVRRRARNKYLCLCDCGNELEVFASNLRRGNSKSCGCTYPPRHNFVDLTGQTFGELTVVNRSEAFTKTRGALWNCICSCGKPTQVASNSLSSGNNKTCGDSSIHYRSPRCGEIPLSHVNAIRQNAIKRNIEFAVSPEYLDEIFRYQRKICGLTGVPLKFTDGHDAKLSRSETTASLDRIDNKQGYIEGNVRWVHKHINKMRNAFSDDEFVIWCRLATNYITSNHRPGWDEWFVDLCHDVKRRSRDKRTKVGCLIVSPDNRILSEGYNSFPSGANDGLNERYQPALKYKFTVHAEQNAFSTASKHGIALNGSRIYITHYPCMECARAIIQNGITEVIYDFYHDATWDSEKYRDDRDFAATLFSECGVKLRGWKREIPE